jgi:tetratricopeptide (TPR) repeat protein
MHLFIIVTSKKGPLNPEWAKKLLAKYDQLIIPIKNPFINEWSSKDGRMYVKSWCRKGIIYSERDFFYADYDTSRLHLFDGWVKFAGQKMHSSLKILYSQKKHENLNFNDYSSEFTYLRLDSDGSGELFRNKSGVMPVYFAENNNVQILSNRASIASLVMNGSPTFELDPIFQISMLGVGWPLFGSTLFKNIDSIHPRNEIYIKNSRISVSKTDRDIYHVEQLRSLFNESSKSFWDNLFDILCDSIKILLEVDEKHPITFFLSGGKDSRLIFALAKRASLLDKLDIVSTGAPYSHDVIVASQITSHYNIEHRFTDNIFKNINYSELLPSHIFLSEARTGPFNISMFNENSNIVTLAGHEIGLREDIVTKNFDQIDINTIIRMNQQYFGDFNYAGILKSEIQKQFIEMVEEWLVSAVRQTPDISNIPWRFRNEFRCSGYVGFVKFLGDFQKGFAPYILMTDAVLSYAYNAGVEARISEQFHYEILKRLDPWLVYDCPFGSQKWSHYIRKENSQRGIHFPPAFPILKSKNAPKLGAFAVFNNNRQQIFDYILDDNNELFEFVDKTKVEKLNKPTNINDKTLRIIMNMFMLKYIANTRNFVQYSPLTTEGTPNNIPEVKLNISPQIDEKLFKDKSIINALLEKSARADYYRDAMIQLLWETNYSNRGNNLVKQGRNAIKENNFEEALLFFLDAAKLGNNEAKLELGRLYFTGKGVDKSYAKAVQYFSEALEAKISVTAFQLAKFFDAGLGIERNGRKALTLFLEAIARKFLGT